MNRAVSTLIVLACCYLSASGQTYQLSWGLDLPLVGGAIGTTLASSLVTQNVEALTVDEVAALDPNDVNGLDRFATENWSPSAGHASDAGLVIGGLAPFATLIPKAGREELGTIVIMGLEGLFLTYGSTSLTKAVALRARPFVYNPNADEVGKYVNDARFSFFSGHTSLTAYGCFFTAKVLHDLHPDARWRPYLWGGAALVSGATGYLRIAAGKHFPTDVITGFAVGAGIGWLVPALHKGKSETFSLYPTGNGLGMALRF